MCLFDLESDLDREADDLDVDRDLRRTDLDKRRILSDGSAACNPGSDLILSDTLPASPSFLMAFLILRTRFLFLGSCIF